jgi:hypothetical protein
MKTISIRKWNFKRFILPAILAIVSASSLAESKRSEIMAPSISGKPYIKNIEEIQSIKVWIVNGQYVREHLDEEFTNFGQHYRFPFIPINEFWLDQQHAPGEEQFFIDHLLIEYRLMRKGMDYDQAIDKADAAEKAERAKTALFQKGEALLKSGQTAQLINKIHKEFLSEFGSAVKVWVVDGELVREMFYIDFTEGGHDKVYKFVPAGEIWIDDDVMPEERRFILLHEMHERYLMAHGWNYGKAHKDSSRIEFKCRLHPEELDAALKKEIQKNGLLLNKR